MDTIHIICNIDDNYVMPYMTTVCSLRKNNPETPFHIHILSAGLKSDTEKAITSYSSSLDLPVSFYTLDRNWVESNLPQLTGHISTATFYRCFMSDVLPAEIHRALYIDCDLLVTDNLDELWRFDMGDAVVGVVEDMWALNGIKDERLGYPASYSYFNAGVLLINMDRWREMNVSQLSLDFIRQYKEVLKYNDQDILNGIFYNRKIWLPVRYNMQDGFYRRRRKFLPQHLIPEVDANLRTPAILHYTGGHKPWDYKCYHPLAKLYAEYLAATPFAHYKPVRKWGDWFEKHINKLLWTLGLAKPKYKKI